MRFAESLGNLIGFERAPVKRPKVHNERSIAFGHVLPCALTVIRRRRFAQHVLRGKDTILCLPAARAPAAVRNVITNRPVEGSSIRPRLATGDDATNKLFENWMHG